MCGGAASLETLSGEDNTIEDYGVCGAIDGGNGKDRVYRFVSAERQTVTVSLSIRQNGEEKCNNYDLYVLEEACSGTACLHRSGNANLFDCNERITFQTRPGTVYLFVVEPPVFAGTESGFDLTVSCE